MMAMIDQTILDIMKEKQPDNVGQLVQLVQEKFTISKEEAIKHIIDLNNKGKLTFKEHSFLYSQKDYVFSIKGVWYWSIITLALATSITVFTIPENALPIVHLRYLLGSIFIFFLPGFCLIKALFPQKELDNIERGALSVAMSLTIVPITSFLLNYTSWGITNITVTISLLTLTLIFATVALLREREMQLNTYRKN